MAADTGILLRRGRIDSPAAGGPRPPDIPCDRLAGVDAVDSIRAIAAQARGRADARADFRPGERLIVAIGAMATGAVAGLLLLLALGRTAPEARLAAALILCGYVVYLISLSMREVMRARRADGIALFAIHVCALLAWPLLAAYLEPSSWQLWLGPPVSLAALVAFLALPNVPIRVTYRSGLHASLIAGIAAFAYASRALGA